MLNLIPYALAAYGGYQGYRGAKQQGATGLGSLLRGALGAYGGYTAGSAGLQTFAPNAYKSFAASQPLFLSRLPGTPSSSLIDQSRLPPGMRNPNLNQPGVGDKSLLDLLRKGGDPSADFSGGRVATAIGLGTYLSGAFDPGPTDIFMPGYNMSYLDLKEQRPGYTYIDPTTGQEKAYTKVYSPEEAGRGQRRVGPYSLNQTRLKTGGLAEIKKFNEGGINYLPSKVSHDENDANNYVRASGYVEDGAGAGDKDEDTMLAQLADGEFVTRADGVLGAGILAGANPKSMKDMREKGAQYFYEQQRRYKRIFDLLEDRNGDSKQKIN